MHFLAIEHRLADPSEDATDPNAADPPRGLGDLRIIAGSEVIYRDVEFPLIALAVELDAWAKSVDRTGGSFAFVSPDGARGQVLFRILPGRDGWNWSSVQQTLPSSAVYSLDQVLDAVDAFVHQLDESLREAYGRTLFELAH